MDKLSIMSNLNKSPQKSRQDDYLFWLDPSNIKIDDRKTGDFLNYIYRLSGLVKYYDEQLVPATWKHFFEKSEPVLLARIHKLNTEKFNVDFEALLFNLRNNPQKESVKLVFDFLYFDVIKVLADWQKKFSEQPSGFNLFIDNVISANLKTALNKFIMLCHEVDNYYCFGKYSFVEFQKSEVWGLSQKITFPKDGNTAKDGNSTVLAIADIEKRAFDIFSSFITVLKELSINAPDFIESSLVPLQKDYQKNHAPHLGLLFTFLKLFKHFQNDLNQLTEKHLKHFYKEVLNIKQGDDVVDKAHIIFDIPKNTNPYLLKKGTALKDGKDDNNKDIFFALEKDIIVDKSKVEKLMTLYVNKENYTAKAQPKRQNCAEITNTCSVIENVYFAPDTKMADGIDKDFAGDVKVKSWPALGAKKSKYPNKQGNLIDYPKPSIGFVLASPVLLLKESARTIEITLTCDVGKDKKECAKLLNNIENLEKAFNVYVSGEEKWLKVKNEEIKNEEDKNEKPKTISITTKGLNITITIKLPIDFPAVTFYDKEIYKKDIGTDMPAVKIMLNPAYSKTIDSKASKPCCELEKYAHATEINTSIYHYFQHLKVNDASIDVSVCGLKNVVVQNDTAVQDVNGLIYPFGIRPKVGSSFYIGSKEVLYKNWQEMCINVEWKDLPKSFENHYQHYKNGEPFEDGSNEITNASFKVSSALLLEGKWKPLEGEGGMTLFEKEAEDGDEVENKPKYKYKYPKPAPPKNIPLPSSKGKLLPYQVNSLQGFLKMDLTGVSFQHDRYPFVLARHLLAIADLTDPISIAAATTKLSNVDKLIQAIQTKIASVNEKMLNIEGKVIEIQKKLGLDDDDGDGGVDVLIEKIKAELKQIIGNLGQKFTAKIILAALTGMDNVGEIIDYIILTLKLKEGFLGTIVNDIISIKNDIKDVIKLSDDLPEGEINVDNLDKVGIAKLADSANIQLTSANNLLKADEVLKNGLPKEPWTPIIKTLSLDYTAIAKNNDISLIHLLPFENTFSKENFTENPSLLPYFEEEGTLFIGLKDLSPRTTLNLLFQLAEATANTESEKAGLKWYYLNENNDWITLREGFHITNDDTLGLTRSGIVEIFIPSDISNKGYTKMPSGLFWLKVTAKHNTDAVCEIIGVHAQAAKVAYQAKEGNKRNKLLLPAESLANLAQADSKIKSLSQPYDSFGGKKQDGTNYYQKVSQRLRHKGRGITGFDYESLVLEVFPQVLKAECLHHYFALPASKYQKDVDLAPGFVSIALIPNPKKLAAGLSLAPRVPISLLEEIEMYLKSRISPFIRLKVVNPRYEKVDLELSIVLREGRGNIEFYTAKIQNQIQAFLAPWSVGEHFEALNFGQQMVLSDLVKFIEKTDDVDYICSIKNFKLASLSLRETGNKVIENIIYPQTQRSILTAGNIEVNIVDYITK